jgi:hypothetical protein
VTLVGVPESVLDRDDVNAILEALFDIRSLLARLVDFFENSMKAKRKRTPEQRATDRERGKRVERLLRERIAYHEEKLREAGRAPKTLEELLDERRAKLRAEGRDLPTLEERIAHHQEKPRGKRPAAGSS